MDQSLAELVRAHKVTREAVLAHCFHPDELLANLDRLV